MIVSFENSGPMFEIPDKQTQGVKRQTKEWMETCPDLAISKPKLNENKEKHSLFQVPVLRNKMTSHNRCDFRSYWKQTTQPAISLALCYSCLRAPFTLKGFSFVQPVNISLGFYLNHSSLQLSGESTSKVAAGSLCVFVEKRA